MVVHQARISGDSRSQSQPSTPSRSYPGILRHNVNQPMPPSPASRYVYDLHPRKEETLMIPHTADENRERMGVTTVANSAIAHRMDAYDTTATVNVAVPIATQPPPQPCTRTLAQLLDPSTFDDAAQQLHLHVSVLSEQMHGDPNDIGYFCDVTRWAYNSPKIQKCQQLRRREQERYKALHDVQAHDVQAHDVQVHQTQQCNLVRELIVPLRIHQLKQAFVGLEDSSAQQYVFPVPVRTLMVRVRPDKTTSAIMSVVKGAIEQAKSRSKVFEYESNLCQAVVVDRQEGDRGAFLLDAQLCVARTSKLERILMLRLYHCHPGANKQQQQQEDNSSSGAKHGAGGCVSATSTGSTDSTGSTTSTATRNADDINNTFTTYNTSAEKEPSPLKPSTALNSSNAQWLDQLLDASKSVQQAIGELSAASFSPTNEDPCNNPELPMLSKAGSSLFATSQGCINSILRRLVLTEAAYHTDTKWKYHDQETPLELDVDYLMQASEIMGRNMHAGHYFSIMNQELEANVESMQASLEDFVSLTKPAMMRYKMNMKKYVARMPSTPTSFSLCAGEERADEGLDRDEYDGMYQDLDVYSLASSTDAPQDGDDRDDLHHDGRNAALIAPAATDHFNYSEDEDYARDNYHRTMMDILDYGVAVKKYQRRLIRQIGKSVSLQAELAASIADKLIDHATAGRGRGLGGGGGGRVGSRHDSNCHRSTSAFRQVKQVPLLRVMLDIRKTTNHLDDDGIGIDGTGTATSSSSSHFKKNTIDRDASATSPSTFPYCMIVTSQLLLCSISASETILFDIAQVSFAVSSLQVLTVRDGKRIWSLTLECIDAPRLCRFFRSLQALLGVKL